MPEIVQKPIGRNCGFANQLYKPTWFVVHFTGGTPNIQSLYNYWLSQCGVGSNSHYGIERTNNQYAKAGDIWQFLPLTDGACANCCLEAGAAPFLPTNVNLNVRTVSVECINPDTGNNGDMPQAQFDSLVYLIQTVCKQLAIPTNLVTNYWNGYEDTKTWGTSAGGIIMHRDIAPRNRRMCPGTPYYSGQMQRIIDAVNGGSTNGGQNYMQIWGTKANGMYIRMWEQIIVMRNTRLPVEQQIAIPRRDTGIFNKWKELAAGGNYLGGVTSEEYQYNSDSNAYMVQNFSAGQIAYNLDTRAYNVIWAK